MQKILSGALALTMLATNAVTLSAPADARGWHGGGYHGGGWHGGYHGSGYHGGGHGYRGGYYGGRGYYGGGWHHRHHYWGGGDVAAAAIIGLAAGAYLASPGPYYHRTYYDDRGPYNRGYYGDSHTARCEANYRSYDPRSDTFIGNDGREYYCNL